MLLRNLRAGQKPEVYTLVCNNRQAKERISVLSDVRLNYAAPVIWHRKKDIIIP